MTKYLPFVYDDSKYYTNQKCFFITTKYPAYLTAFLNSSLFKFCFRDNFPELQGGTRELSKIFFDKIPVMKINEEIEDIFMKMIKDIQSNYTKEIAQILDQKLFELYQLSKKEQDAIGYIEIE